MPAKHPHRRHDEWCAAESNVMARDSEPTFRRSLSTQSPTRIASTTTPTRLAATKASSAVVLLWLFWPSVSRTTRKSVCGCSVATGSSIATAVCTAAYMAVEPRCFMPSTQFSKAPRSGVSSSSR